MNITLSIEIITCYKCQVPFGLTDDHVRRLRNTHEGFYCPAGHHQSFQGESKAEKLERELNNQKQQNARLADEAAAERRMREREMSNHEGTKRKLRGVKASRTILKKRVGAGKCPCCSEHFPNLELHMKKQHPDGKVVPMRKAV